MKKLARLLGACMALSVLAGSPAGARSGIHASAFGGFAVIEKMSIEFREPFFASLPYQAKMDPGFVAGASAGITWDLGETTDWKIMIEGEGALRRNSNRAFGGPFPFFFSTGFSATGDNVDGALLSTSFMGNIVFAYDRSDSMFVPYVGGGVGVAFVSADLSVTDPTSGTTVDIYDDTKAAAAFQLFAGVAFRLIKNIEVGLEYRYFSILNLQIKPTDQFRTLLVAGTESFFEFGNIQNHAVLLKVTIKLPFLFR